MTTSYAFNGVLNGGASNGGCFFSHEALLIRIRQQDCKCYMNGHASGFFFFLAPHTLESQPIGKLLPGESVPTYSNRLLVGV
jgi:hypothetical protein